MNEQIKLSIIHAQEKSNQLLERTKANFLFNNLSNILGNLMDSIKINDREKILFLSNQISQISIHQIEYFDEDYADELCRLSAKVRKLLDN